MYSHRLWRKSILENEVLRGDLRMTRLFRRFMYFCSNFHASYCLLIRSNISVISTSQQQITLFASARLLCMYMEVGSEYEPFIIRFCVHI